MDRSSAVSQGSSDEMLRDLLVRVQRIAIVGASTDTWRPSFSIASYLKRNGYHIVPVNPHEVGGTLHGEPFRASLADIDGAVDLVNVFRRPDALAGVVDEAVAAGIPAIWAQIGVHSREAAQKAQVAGLTMIMNRCISMDHGRLGIGGRR